MRLVIAADIGRHQHKLRPAVGVATVVAIAAGVAAWATTPPRPFGAYIGSAPSFSGEMQVGVPMYVGVLLQGDAVLESARARLGDDSVPTSVGVVGCVRAPGPAPVIGTMSGDDLSDFCSAVVPVEGINPVDESTYLVVAVTAFAPGPVTIEGVDVAFGSGWRHGKQRVGPLVAMDVTD